MTRSVYTLTFITSSLVIMCQAPIQAHKLYYSNIKTSAELINPVFQALDSDYPVFKKNAEQQIANNDKQIADFLIKINRPGTLALDDVRRQKIDDLTKKNNELRKRLFTYEKVHTDWVVFKHDFNNDMDYLRIALRDLYDGLKN